MTCGFEDDGIVFISLQSLVFSLKRREKLDDEDWRLLRRVPWKGLLFTWTPDTSDHIRNRTSIGYGVVGFPNAKIVRLTARFQAVSC